GKTKDTWGSNHGTVVGAEWVDDCVYGKCYKFNGTSDYIDCGNNETLKPKNFTVTIWFNAKEVSTCPRYFIGNGKDSYPSKGFGFYMNTSNSMYFRIQGGGGLDSSIIINTWEFATLIYEEGVGSKLYLNGVLKNSNDSFQGSIVYDTHAFNIGRLYTTYYFFNGLIDDVRIYNSALSSAQIKQNYIAGLDSMLRNGGLSKDEYSQRLQALANTDFAF
ncbi:MAG: LamG domain-containing protein, partial [Candidatus Paceibacterota bacterium]